MTVKTGTSTIESGEQQVQFNIRTSFAEKRRIEEAARASRQSLTEFTRRALAEKADEVLDRQEQIVLSDRDYRRFVAMLSEDSEPTDIAVQEAAEFNKGTMDGVRYRW